MKNSILFILLLMPMTMFAQEDAFGPQKKDNLIIVTTDTVDAGALNKAVKCLIDNGYTIKSKDVGAGTIITNVYDYRKGKLSLNIIIALNELKIWGEFEPNLALISGSEKSKTLRERISFLGAKGNADKEAWNTMDAYANQISQTLKGSVSYAKW
jgi:hypothetical protein